MFTPTCTTARGLGAGSQPLIHDVTYAWPCFPRSDVSEKPRVEHIKSVLLGSKEGSEDADSIHSFEVRDPRQEGPLALWDDQM